MAWRIDLLAVAALPVRAGYAALWLAILVSLGGALGLASVTGWWATDPSGTVADVLGIDGPDAPDLDRRRAGAVVAMTSRCMAARGLPYPAVVEAPPWVPDASLDPEAWAARWGFGVSTSLSGPAASASTPAAPDPLAALLTTQGPAERARYVAALHGTEHTPGCLARATDAVYGLRERLLAPLRGPLGTLDTAIDRDPAMRVVRNAWGSCVRRAVEPLDRFPDPPERERLAERLIAWFAARAGDTGDAASRVALAGLERRTAVDVARCELTFSAGRARVAQPHEAAFVAAHRPELLAIGASIRATEAGYPATVDP